MCGRYTLIKTSEISDRFHTTTIPTEISPNYNAAPGQVMPVITANGQQNEIRLMKWGLVPSWAREVKIGYKMINARSEGIESKPSFRHAYKKQRCLVPASGFYEWQKSPDGKIPQYIYLEDKSLFAFAGLWEYWQQPGSDPLETFTIITTQANTFMKPIHDRMPVILEKKFEDDWLNQENQDSDFLHHLIKNSKPELASHEVSTQVNSPKNNTPEIIKPLTNQA